MIGEQESQRLQARRRESWFPRCLARKCWAACARSFRAGGCRHRVLSQGHRAHGRLRSRARPHAGRPRVRRIKTPTRSIPAVRSPGAQPEVMAILHALLGDAIRLHGSKLNMKSPHYGSPVEWHQDWAFYPHTNDDVLAVGVMLDDCTHGERSAAGRARHPQRARSRITTPDGRFCGAIDPDEIRD